MPSALQDAQSTAKVVPATKPPPKSKEPITKPPSDDESEDSDDVDTGDRSDSKSSEQPCISV